MQKNLPCFSFVSFLIVSLTPFINKADFSRDLIIFMISSISLFENIDVVMPDSLTLFWIAVSLADAVAVNHNGIRTNLTNGLSTFSSFK